MADRIAIKRLTASDCTLFEEVFRKINAGNQKSINLNADVLTGQLYPNLGEIAAKTDNEIALPISIYGPAAKAAHKLSRKIVKNASYKNWRLNGEFILGPQDDQSRYGNIAPGDLAVLAFKGTPAPTRLDLILVSNASPDDGPLHAELASLFGNRSMIAVTPTQVSEAAKKAGIAETHPLYLAAADPDIKAALEDASQGGLEGTYKLQNKLGKKVTAADLAEARSEAQSIGQDGEGLINAYLAAEVAKGNIASYKWASSENAVSPYDFEVTTNDGKVTLVDVKSTSGLFESIIHISLAEIIAAAGAPYRLYRVHQLDENGGSLRISDEIGSVATDLKQRHEATFPPEVRVDSFSIATSFLKWGEDEYVERPEE